MSSIDEENILHLSILIKECEEPMINEQQRIAAEMLVDLARKGNANAFSALQNLERFPWIHPHLQEIIREGLQHFSPPKKSSLSEKTDSAPKVPGMEHLDGMEKQVVSHVTSHRDTQIENMLHSVKSITRSMNSEYTESRKSPHRGH
jgi:hypothetical protein